MGIRTTVDETALVIYWRNCTDFPNAIKYLPKMVNLKTNICKY